jgi:hypothetical protein
MGGKKARIQATARYNVRSQRGRILRLRRGEAVTLLKVNCWAGTNETGVEGVFRDEHVRFLDESDHTRGARTLVHSPRSGGKELFFLKGELITDIRIIWWKAQNERGDLGYIPSKCVQVTEDDSSGGNGRQYANYGEVGSSILYDQNRQAVDQQTGIYTSPPTARDCLACGDTLTGDQFAESITARCKHENSFCRNCVQQWIASQIETASWDCVKCPAQCNEMLEHSDVRRHAARHTFER